LISAGDYVDLRRKGYTHTLIAELVWRDPVRLREMIEDAWQFPCLGDPSAPLQVNSPAASDSALARIEHDVMRLRREPPKGVEFAPTSVEFLAWLSMLYP
jgi:hypothetical protein